MSGLRPRNTARFHNSKPCEERGTKEKLKFILDNQKALLTVRGGDKLLAAAKNMNAQTEPLTKEQMPFIDNIMERTYEGLGLPSWKSMRRR